MALPPQALIVIPDKTLAAIVGQHAKNLGFELVMAANAAEALSAAKERRPAVAVISQLLSGKDGVALSAELKFEGPLPVLLLAAASTSAGINDVRKASKADVVVGRNFRPDALLREFDLLVAPEEKKPRLKTTHPGVLVPVPAAQTVAEVPVPPAQEAASSSVTSPPQQAAPPAIFTHIAAPGPPIGPIDPASLLSQAHLDRVSGALRFVGKQGVERTVFFANGRPVAATSNLIGDRIGEILVRKGMLSALQLQEALSEEPAQGVRMAQLLVEKGLLTVQRQHEEIAEQYSMRILSLFGLTEASIEFQARSVSPEEIELDLSPERLVIEGLRRHYPASRLERAIGDLGRVPSPTWGAETRLPLLAFTPAEGAVLGFVDGRRTIAEAVGSVPSRPDALRALYACFCLNLLA